VFISIRRNNGLKLHLVEIMKQLLALYSWFKESYERNVCPCCQKKAAKLAPKTRFPAHFGSSLFSVESELRQAEFAGDEVEDGDKMDG